MIVTKTTPQAVSACLRRAGFIPTPRTMAGVHVTRSHGGASVSADWDLEAHSLRAMGKIVEILTAAGYLIEPNPHSATLILVTGRVA